MTTPPGQCPQCWAHGHDPTIHAQLPAHAKVCQACIDCKAAGHPNLIPKK
ncbi:pRL2-8 [Streptomyces olivaceiscleroticus]|uniref:PRL2-8 n=1 Tax=Streptomyces olivaceiscleroticus TaxID=68245 RepID=A0ABP3LK01_9ACTN